MQPYVIVGGGFSGVMAALLLKKRGLDFVGLERSSELGGRAMIGHHRFYQEGSLRYLRSFDEELTWRTVQAPPRERVKGDWRDVGQKYSELESFYLRYPYYEPRESLAALMPTLAETVRHDFKLNHTVVKILPETKRLVCQEGAEYEYDKIVWCSPLNLLAKIWKGKKDSLAKVFKKSEAENGGLNLDLELALEPAEIEETFPTPNSIGFSFRYKDHALRTLGNVFVPGSGRPRLHWLLFLPAEIFEDREEVAKCVRTLKREIQKEFPILKEKVLSERIVYLPQISGEPRVKLKSIEILPDLYYVGSQLQVEDSDEGLANLDRIVANCQSFEDTLVQ